MGGGTLNVEVIGMLVGNCFGKPQNTQIAILRAVLRVVLGKMASIFHNSFQKTLKKYQNQNFIP